MTRQEAEAASVVRLMIRQSQEGRWLYQVLRRVPDPDDDSGFAWRGLGAGLCDTREGAVTEALARAERYLRRSPPPPVGPPNEEVRQGGGTREKSGGR